jgi:putative ABC transport system permease protein
VSPRWRKLLGDVRAAKGRLAMMVLALAAGIFGVGTILSAYGVLTREIKVNYLSTNPATALLELDRVDNSLLQAVRQRPEIVAAEAGSIVLARVEVKSDEWMPLFLFVIPDFNTMQINTFQPEAGAFPPPEGTVLLEREALALIKAKIGDALNVQTPNGTKQRVTIAGTVHDPGLAPAWQEQTVYAYTTPETLALLGESGDLHLLKIVLEQPTSKPVTVENTVSNLAAWLKQQGHTAGEIRIPPPGKHPHQTQMTAILVMLLIFAFMALLLSAILTATTMSALLAQQVRQIGVMKTIGTRTSQITTLYLVLVMLMGVAALIIGLPLSILVGRSLSNLIAQLLNFRLYSHAIPMWVFVVQISAGLLLPVLAALVPIAGATRTTILQAISDYGVARTAVGSRTFDALLGSVRILDRTLVLALRNTFRRKGRLLMTLALLAAAGALFITSLNVKSAWQQSLASAAEARQYDAEIRLSRPESEAKIKAIIGAIPGVEQVETWNRIPAAVNRADGLDIVRTYPDGGHGSFSLRSAPPESKLVGLTLLAGRWLEANDANAIVLNHTAKAFFPNVQVGDELVLTVARAPVTFKVVGITKELLTPASAYVTPQTYANVLRQPGQANALRVVLKQHDKKSITAVTKEIEEALERGGIHVSINISETLLDNAVSGHVYILIFTLIAMSALMAVVGALGLVSAMGTSVLERTREFGIMRTIGGRSCTILRNVISEGVFIGLMSWFIAVLLALPLSALVGNLIGTLAFRSPLSLVVSPSALVIWLGLIVLGSMAASAYPAWTASRLTIRETLAYV